MMMIIYLLKHVKDKHHFFVGEAVGHFKETFFFFRQIKCLRAFGGLSRCCIKRWRVTRHCNNSARTVCILNSAASYIENRVVCIKYILEYGVCVCIDGIFDTAFTACKLSEMFAAK